MSFTPLAASTAIAASSLILLLLALRDPKRLRAASRPGFDSTPPAMAPGTRRLLGWSSLVPGAALMVLGQWPVFLIWLGAVTAVGWGLAQGLAPRRSRKASK